MRDVVDRRRDGEATAMLAFDVYQSITSLPRSRR